MATPQETILVDIISTLWSPAISVIHTCSGVTMFHNKNLFWELIKSFYEHNGKAACDILSNIDSQSLNMFFLFGLFLFVCFLAVYCVKQKTFLPTNKRLIVLKKKPTTNIREFLQPPRFDLNHSTHDVWPWQTFHTLTCRSLTPSGNHSYSFRWFSLAHTISHRFLIILTLSHWAVYDPINQFTSIFLVLVHLVLLVDRFCFSLISFFFLHGKQNSLQQVELISLKFKLLRK